MSRSLLRMLAVLTAALLLIGACGDDDEGAGTPTADPTDEVGDDEGADDEPTDDEGDVSTTTGSDDSGDQASGMPSVADVAFIDDYCGLFAVFSEIDDPASVGGGPDDDPEDAAEALREAFTMFDALFARAVDLAPDEIQADTAVLAGAIGGFNELLAEYDYDFMSIGMAASEDPAIQQRMSALDNPAVVDASDRIEDYVLAECGIDLS